MAAVMFRSWRFPSLLVRQLARLERVRVPDAGVTGISNVRRNVATTLALKEKQMVTVTFIRNDGERITVKGKVGDNLLDVVVNNNVDLDGFGACEGTLSCSTCHLVFKKEDYNRLPNKPTDEELDMLDLAYGLSDTSRLGCQVCLSKDLDGLELQVPSGINDARE